jgi:acylphosphatase
VTGVGFRYSTLREAEKYPGLVGWVRNVDSRTVECLLQGPAAEVAQMLLWLRQGPPGARVVEFQVSPCPLREGLKGFELAL